MSRVIKNFTKNFTIADNRVAQCEELDLNAKGLYLYIASLPDDWEFSIERIARANNTTEGKVKSAINQLEKAGLLKRHYSLNADGKRGFRADYEIFDFDTREENISDENSIKDFSINKNSTPKNSIIENVGDYINNNITKKESYKEIILNNQKEKNIKKEKVFDFDCDDNLFGSEKKDEDYFSEFWSLYPRKVSKKEAHKCFKKALKENNASIIIDGLKKWIKKWDCDKTDVKFIPHASTWLNQERFNDDLESNQVKTEYEFEEDFNGTILEWRKKKGLL